MVDDRWLSVQVTVRPSGMEPAGKDAAVFPLKVACAHMSSCFMKEDSATVNCRFVSWAHQAC